MNKLKKVSLALVIVSILVFYINCLAIFSSTDKVSNNTVIVDGDLS